jgi:large repetitive protein
MAKVHQFVRSIGFFSRQSMRLPTINQRAGVSQSGKSNRALRTGLVIPLISGMLAGAASALPIVEEWFVPQPEAQLRQDYAVLAPAINSITDSVIAVTVPIAGTKVVYDQWEDGYETDLGNPTQATTQIWGDGNNANGKPPGFANDPSSFSAGALVLMRNNVTLPRNAATLLYDGRDRLGSTYGIVMTRAAWFTDPGPLLANSVEVRPVADWGTSFVLPVGENIVFPSPATSSMFEHCSAYIQAAANGTVVTIDADGPGAGTAVTVTLNQGESYLVNAGIRTGATITSTKGIQVIEFYGDIGANYESRGANIPPLAKWSDQYLAPVGTAPDGDDTYVYLHNPDTSAITVNYVTKVGTGSFSVPARGTYQFLMPQNSAAHFTSVGNKPFWGVGMVGAEPTANNVHDWGYALVPEDFLSTEIAVGWGAGSSDGTQNGSPVWVTSMGATTIYVDYNGDRLGLNTDSNGGKYDVSIAVTPMTVTTVYDPDRDQSSMRLYTLDGTLITGAWGQQPSVAGPALPYLDLGNTLPNYPVPVISKVSTIAVDNAPSGLSVNDVLEYTITLENKSLFSLTAIAMLDTLPTSLTYVNATTTRDGNAVADAGVTNFPMDESGLFVPVVPSRTTTVVKFRATINAAGTITNTVTVPSSPGVKASDTVNVPTSGGSVACTLKLTNAAGTEVNYVIGDGVYVTVTDADANTSSTTVQTFTVLVANSLRDDFELITLTETGVNTGVFRNTSPLPSSSSEGIGQGDGTLYVEAGDSISATHTDPVFGDTCPDTATFSSPGVNKFLYLDEDAANGDTTGDLDRVSPADVSPADSTTSQTSVIAAPIATTDTYSTAGSTTWTVPAGVTSITVEARGGGGAGGGSTNAGTGVARGGAGGGGGAFASSTLSVTPGQQLTIVVPGQASGSSGASGANGSPAFVGPDGNSANALVRAAGGSGGAGNTSGNTPAGGAGGTVAGSVGTTRTAGANGADGASGFGISSGAGGAGAQSGGTGGAGIGTVGGTANGNAGNPPGGAGGGSRTSQNGGSQTGGSGAVGRVVISYSAQGGSATWTQTPGFAEAFNLTSAPSVTAHYTVSSGTMPSTPSVSAVLRKNGVAIATSSSVSASATTGAGVFSFSFPALGSPVSFAANDVTSLVITNNQSGVSFRVDYDSSTKPSKVTLPTNTVIHNDSLGLYDAPYPGGNAVVTPSLGQTVYVRATAGDPFGAYDITSMGLVIDGPGSSGDVTTTLTAANVVNTTAATKTYEYVWVTGATEGSFTITTTAKEGFENTISATRSISVPLSGDDLGTPSVTEFTTGLNGPGTLVYAVDEPVAVRVTDVDQNTNPLVAETVTVVITSSTGDSETVTLTETGVNTGVFAATIPASGTVAGTANNGTLYAIAGSVLNVTYVDPTDPLDTSSDSATIPSGVEGVSVTKTLLSPADGQIVIGEAAQFRVRVTNTGNTLLSTVQVQDTFPAALGYVSASPTPNTVTGSVLTWTNVGPLASGQSVDLIVNFIGVSAANPATNIVNVTTGGGPTASASAPVVVTRPAVTVVKTLVSPNPGPANKGDNVVFNISVQNTGTTALTTVPLEDTFSGANFEFVSATVAPDGVGSGSLLWNDITGAGSLAVNATFAVNVTLKVVGAANPATNVAAVNFAVDANGDSVPPSSSSAGLETLSATISGFVYEDLGTPGFGGGDVPLEGVTVKLYSDPNGDGDPTDGSVQQVTTTNGSGYYEFLNLGAGTYVVVEEDILSYASVADTAGANDNRIPVNVVALTGYTGNNFLDVYIDPANYGAISGQVRNDTDGDGNFADADSGLAGAVLTLYTDPNGDGDPSDGQVFGASVTTTASGTYSFSTLPPGNYVVVETNPSGYFSTADTVNPNNDRIPVLVVASATASGNNFLDSNNTGVLGTIGNLVWSDVNNNGIFDSGSESGIDGVVVQLYQSSQTPGVSVPYMTTVTSGGGAYAFANIPAGSYTLYIPVSNFGSGAALAGAPLSSTVTVATDNGTDNDDNGIQTVSGGAVSSPLVVLTGGETDNTKDFGFVPTSSLGSITGAVLADTNNDNTGDTGISGVVLTLKDASGADIDSDPNAIGVQPTIATTAVDGSYSFTGLPPASYRVVEAQPSGYASVSDKDGGDLNVIGDQVLIVVSAGAANTGNDFVEEQYGSIAGAVSLDTNNDGTADAVFSGVTVQLYADSDNDGAADNATVLDTAVTDGSGGYSFVNVLPGSYVVVEVDPAGYTSIADGDATADAPGSPADFANVSQTDSLLPVNLAAGETDNGNNFVDRGTGSIGDYVWMDRDGDGVQEAGEPPLAGVRVYIDANGSQTYDVGENAAVTSGVGAYVLSGLAPGTYAVRVDTTTLPAGAVATSDRDGTGSAHATSVVLSAGQSVTDADFGYRGVSSIGDYVWNDADGDGNQDSDELPLSGVTVFLDIDLDGNLDANEPSAVTNGAGAYVIGNLPAGSYRVTVLASSLPIGASQTGDPDGVFNNWTIVNLGAADTHVTADFGYQGNLSIGDIVWNDRDGDGVQDGVTEPGIGSVNVFIDTDNDGVRDPHEPFAQTNASGAYVIGGLLPGTYKVMLDPLTIPAGTTVTGDPEGAVDGIAVVVLTAPVTNVDFGLKGIGSIGGHLWSDRNADGVTDADETFFAGVKVFIDVDGDGVYEPGMGDQETTTNAAGEYAFAGLAAGSYTVSVNTATLPADLSQTYDKDGVLNHRTTTVIVAGDVVTDLDFGYRGAGQIGDRVWNDMNGDGVQGATEPPLAGVWVYLDLDGDSNRDVGEPAVVTNAAGGYLFEYLTYGTYTVAVDPSTYPDGSVVTGDPDATMDARTAVTVSALVPSVVTADFGFQGSGSIGDYVWYDVDGDGVQDAGEPAMAGVRVYLDLDNDGVLDGNEPSVLTSVSGAYGFTGLTPRPTVGAPYVVAVDESTLPASFVASYDLDGTATGQPFGASVTLLENQSRVDADFGFKGSATVSGHLYIDTNGNGVQNLGEPDLAGVDVVVTDVNGAVLRVTTDPSGNWVVTVPPGLMTANVDETDPQFPTGVVQTEGTDSTEVTAVAGVTTSAGNDGYFPSGTISGRVWVDSTRDGNGDSGLGGVTVQLFEDADEDGLPDSGTPFRTTTSAGSGTVGAYAFTGVPVGSYLIVEVQPAGYRTVSDADVTADTDVVANTLTGDNLIPATIAAGEVDDGNYFIEEAICPPTWAEWQIRNPLGGSNGPTQNPDGDRWTNLHEFAYCFNPSSGVLECPVNLVFNGDGTIDATVRQVVGATGVTYRLEYIADLRNSGVDGAGWTDSGLTAVLTNNPDGSIKATYANLESLPGLNLGYGFVRSVVTVDVDNSNSIGAGETIRSNVEGWMDQSFRVNCESCSLPFESCPLITGAAGAVTGAGLTSSFSATSALGQTSFSTLLTAGKGYYVEMLNGALEGHRFHVDTAATRLAGTSVVIDTVSGRNTVAVPADFLGANYVVRAYKTLGEQFPAADFTAGLSAAEADYLIVYDVETATWKTISLLNLSGTPTWIMAGNLLAGSQAGYLIDPSAALFVHRRSAGTAGPTLTRTISGGVRSNKFAMPLPAGCRMGSNPWPVAASIIGRGLLNPTTASAVPFTGATSSGAADQVMLWSGDTTMGSLTQEVHYYLKTSTRDQYTRAGNSNLPNTGADLLFRPLRSQYYCPKVAHPDYVMPLPWVP